MAAADELATRLHRQLQQDVFGKGYRALLMPTLATPYFPADNDPTKDALTINGRPVKGPGYILTYIWNLLSRYPVVDVPVGVAPNISPWVCRWWAIPLTIWPPSGWPPDTRGRACACTTRSVPGLPGQS